MGLNSYSAACACPAAQLLLESGTFRVKLADFGLAKGNAQTATKGVGTPAYMPPEMFEEQRASDKKGEQLLAADVYALGIIMWELWYQMAPFSDQPVARVVLHVMRGKRLPFTEVDGVEPMPELFKPLIEKCWAQEVVARPPVASVARAFKKIFPHAGKPLAPKRIRTTSKPNVSRSLTRSSNDVGKAAAKAFAVGHGDLFSLDALPAPTPAKGSAMAPTSLTSRGLTVRGFLEGAGLSEFLGKFIEYGFTDIGMLSDKELLDDETLIGVIGMSRPELRTFRARIVAAGASATMMRSRTSAKSRQGEKVDPTERGEGVMRLLFFSEAAAPPTARGPTHAPAPADDGSDGTAL